MFQPDGSPLSLPVQMYRHKQPPYLRVTDHSRPHYNACFPVRRSFLHTISVSRATMVKRIGLCNISSRTHGMVAMIANGLSVLWGVTLLNFQLKVISKGQTTFFQPHRGRTQFTFMQRFWNILLFLMGSKQFRRDPIILQNV